MSNTSIAVIGVGVVGNAVAEYYKQSAGRDIFLYDKFKKLGSVEEASRADVLFLCLPTPTKDDGAQDISALEEVIAKLPAGKKVVVKSTVLPGTTARFQKQFPQIIFFHNPEFLDARTAVKDFASPEIQIVGCTEASKGMGEEILKLLPAAPFSKVCTSDESETVKYTLNMFMALKNSFANQIYDYCHAKGIDYDTVKDIVKNAPRIGGEVQLKVFADGYRGFAGACLPKDLAAFVHDADATEGPQTLLSLVQSLNKGYTKEKRS